MSNQQKIGIFHLSLLLGGSVIAILFHLVPALIAGLATYTLIQGVENIFLTRLNLGKRSKLLSTILIAVLTIVLMTLVTMSLVSWIQNILTDPNRIILSVQEILNKTLSELPPYVGKYIPNNVHEIQNSLLEFAKIHMSTFQMIGKGTAHTLITVVLGMIIGVFVAYSVNKNEQSNENEKIFTREFFNTVNQYALSFRHVAVAQIGISIFNTVLTAILLIIVFPLLGIHVPFTKSLIIATFLFGLIPILGNIIVNVMVVIASLSVTIWAGVAALAFLVIIHKLEYFLNAKLVGGNINATSYELLIVMVVFESIFGLSGLVLAPIIYAFLKGTLKRLEVI